jgi:hypothetical protein
LVRLYGEWCASVGWTATTEHPIDLVLTRASERCLVEAKVVRDGNSTDATRGALGQLYAYRHFLGQGSERLVGLFSEPIGDAYVAFLGACEVTAVWRDRGTWRGSLRAVSLGLATV